MCNVRRLACPYTRLRRAAFRSVWVAILGGLWSFASAAAQDASSSDSFDRRFQMYKPNYIAYYSNDLRDNQLKFQISVRTSLIDPLNLYVAYTQESFWDRWDESAPFREHDFNPEVFIRWQESGWLVRQLPRAWRPFLTRSQVGWEHQSTGVAGPTSRSWDRLYLEMKFRPPTLWGLKTSVYPRVWWILKRSPENASIDQIDSFKQGWDVGGKLVAVAWRQDRERYAVEVARSSRSLEIARNLIPRWQHFYVYVFLWDGLGDGLVGFDQHTTSIGAGFLLMKQDEPAVATR